MKDNFIKNIFKDFLEKLFGSFKNVGTKMVKYCRELFSLCIRQPSVFAQHAREIWGLTTKISLLNFPPILRMGNIYLKIGEIWGLTTKISLFEQNGNITSGDCCILLLALA